MGAATRHGDTPYFSCEEQYIVEFPVNSTNCGRGIVSECVLSQYVYIHCLLILTILYNPNIIQEFTTIVSQEKMFLLE